jgi:hypothetical protein
MKENWVLVYVRPDCGPCESVFRALGDERRSHGGPRRGTAGGGDDLAEASRREEVYARFARREAAAKSAAGTPAPNSTTAATTSGATTPAPAANKTGAAGSSSVKQDAAKAGARRGYFANVEDAPRKLIIVVGGASVEEVKEMAARMPWIPEGSWYADPSNDVSKKFKWVAAPVITGVTNNVVMWSYIGVPPQGLPLRSLMSAWHERREGPPQKPPTEPHP